MSHVSPVLLARVFLWVPILIGFIALSVAMTKQTTQTASSATSPAASSSTQQASANTDTSTKEEPFVPQGWSNDERIPAEEPAPEESQPPAPAPSQGFSLNPFAKKVQWATKYKAVPICPDCRRPVMWESIKCFSCGTAYEWTKLRCPLCNGDGYLVCAKKNYSAAFRKGYYSINSRVPCEGKGEKTVGCGQDITYQLKCSIMTPPIPECKNCQGVGQVVKCQDCRGGRVTCPECNGAKQLG